ncbi:MAG: OmpA family protein [Bryobacteraceae bacterium]|nr:OmpA family protein [Bryobacteraceae bacterium]
MTTFAVSLSVAAILAQDAPPVYKTQVTARSARAVNYRVRSGSTNIDFKGTALAAAAKGTGRVEQKAGNYAISANFEKVPAPSTFGVEYLTYVLWAITPEGRPSNLGEVILDGDKAKVQSSTELQAFGMIVTAEPYFSVRTPSDVVVLENFIRDDTFGTNKPIDAKFEAIEKDQYKGAGLKPSLQAGKRRIPVDLFQARNAVQIAKWQGAGTWAADTLKKAETELKNAEDMQAAPRGYDAKKVIANAREAAQTAEDARQLAVKRAEDARIAKEQADAAEREAAAKKRAAEELAARQQADEQRRLAEANRQAAELQAARDAAARERAEADRMAAKLKEAQAQQQAAAAAKMAEDARLAKEKAEADQRALRATLLARFNSILETKDTERGLVVNMGDVLFDTGKFNLRPAAREALAKLSGIVLAYPSLKLDIEGHTDSTGSDELNQKLSENRAAEVQKYLLEQKLPAENIAAKGFGKTMPVADNATSKGRQQNRRVEIIVSGEVIGTTVGARQ